MEVIIVTACHNRGQTTENFARRLLAQTHAHWRLVLIDDGSTDDSVERAKRILGKKLIVVRGDGSLFWGGGIEAGLHAAYALAECLAVPCAIAIMNDDIEFSTTLLASQVAQVQLCRVRTCLVTTHVEGPDNRRYVGFSFDSRTLKTRDEINVSSCSCFTTRALFYRYDSDSAPGMNGRRYPHYWSDLDFTLRMKKGGWSFLETSGEEIRYVNQFTAKRTLRRGVAAWRRLWSVRCPMYQPAVHRFIQDHADASAKSRLHFIAAIKLPLKMIRGVY
jgi:GT2 family glycosyltransferase